MREVEEAGGRKPGKPRLYTDSAVNSSQKPA
jgi:hypothetical protein